MKSAVYTIQHNEEWFLPMWIKYYSQHFAPQDMYILGHNCTGKNKEQLEQYEKDGINILYLNTDEIFNHDWLLNEVHTAQRNLLRIYDYVVFTDCDEFIVPKEGTLKEFIDNATEDAYRCTGIDIIEDKMYYSHGFSKTLISKIPLTYCHGYHVSIPEFPISDKLELYHLHKLDFNQCWERNKRLAQENWDKYALDNNLGTQNLVSDEEGFRKMFYSTGDLIEQSDNLIKLLKFLQ